MINATTHTGAERALREEAPVRRISPRLVAALLGIELLLLVGVLLWALSWIAPATPLAATHDLAPVSEAISARLSGQVADPLIELAPGHAARSSNLRGFTLNDTTYYYYVEGAANYDPLSRGAVSDEQVEVLLRDTTGPATVVIYRLP